MTSLGTLQCITDSPSSEELANGSRRTCLPPYNNSCLRLDFPELRLIKGCSDIDQFINVCFVSNLFQLCYCGTDLCNAFCEPVWETCKTITKTNPIVEEMLMKYETPHLIMKECKANCEAPMEKS